MNKETIILLTYGGLSRKTKHFAVVMQVHRYFLVGVVA